MSQIDAAELKDRLQKGESLNLLDVREEMEYLTYNIGGKNIPLAKLQLSFNELPPNKNNELIVICTRGLRSETACSLLTGNGYKNVRNLAGGLIGLQKTNNKLY